MHDRRSSSVRDRRLYSFSDFHELVQAEKERSQRYKHFFIIIGLIVFSRSEQDTLGLLKTKLRLSDYAYTVDHEAGETMVNSYRVAILLPETDLEGAKVVQERLMEMFMVHEFTLQMGQAAYPDDATISEKLIEKAFASALPVGLFQPVS